MSPFGFSALAAAWLFSLLVPLVIFYFLKLKRLRVPVPSLVLWSQVLRDNRVNSPFQKFKRNLLLLLQALLLCLLALAAMQPFWRGRRSHAARLPVLVDCSASMGARDADGRSRLDLAGKDLLARIAGLPPDREMCIIAFSRGARKVTDFTSNKYILRAAVEGLAVEDVPSDIEDALRTTQALALGAQFDEVLLLSDGNFPTSANVALSFHLDYQKLPAAGANIGITSLSARRAPESRWDVFVRVEANQSTQGTGALEVYRGEELAASETVSFTGEGADRMVFRMAGDAQVRVVLKPDGFDALASDNVAYIELPPVRPLWVYVADTDSMAPFRHALEADPGVRITSSTDQAPFDLAVSDRAQDLNIAALVGLWAGIVPDDLKDLVSVRSTGGVVVDWDRTTALLQHVDLADLVMLDEPVSAEGMLEGNYEARGYQVLVHGRGGPLLLERREAAPEGQPGARTEFFMLFHPHRSTLPYRVAFPVMTANLLRLAMYESGLAEVRAARTGVLPALRLEPDTTYRIAGPGRRTAQATTGPDGVLTGVPAAAVGYYDVQGARPQEGRRVGVSLLSPEESSLKAVEDILFREGLTVRAVQGLSPDRALWRWLALLAFGVMLVEWWYFQHRP